jgi:hypothetical protein
MGWTSMRYTEATHDNFNKEKASQFICDEYNHIGYAMAHFQKGIIQHEIYIILKDRDGNPFICVILVTIKDAEIYWKEITEDMGPNYYNCPVEFFKFVPVVLEGFAKQWRKDCAKNNVKLNSIELK